MWFFRTRVKHLNIRDNTCNDFKMPEENDWNKCVDKFYHQELNCILPWQEKACISLNVILYYKLSNTIA